MVVLFAEGTEIPDLVVTPSENFGGGIHYCGCRGCLWAWNIIITMKSTGTYSCVNILVGGE